MLSNAKHDGTQYLLQIIILEEPRLRTIRDGKQNWNTEWDLCFIQFLSLYFFVNTVKDQVLPKETSTKVP